MYITFLCRSTLAKDIDTNSYSAPVNVLSSEDFLSARILVSSALFTPLNQHFPKHVSTAPVVSKIYVASEREQCVVACMRDFFLNSWLHKLNRILTSNVGFFSFLFLQVDRSVIESFVQGGRMSMNTRSYPTVAYGSNAYVYLFNNGTTPINLRSLEVWQMHSASNDESI
jgi:hypothetical protein